MRTIPSLGTTIAAVLLSSATSYATPPEPPLIDASTLASQNPSAVAKALRATGHWREVALLEKGTFVRARNADNDLLFAQWSKGKLLFLSLSLPDRGSGSPQPILALLGITQVPAPSRSWSEMKGWNLHWEWDHGFGPFKWVHVSDRSNLATLQPGWTGRSVRLYYASKAEVQKWESSG